MGNFAAAKAKARRAIHRKMSVAATLQSASSGVLTEGITVRWHNKIVVLGDLQDSGYASVIEGIERIIFSMDEMELLGFVPGVNDVVTITAEEYGGAQLILKDMEPQVGPFENIWQVARL